MNIVRLYLSIPTSEWLTYTCKFDFSFLAIVTERILIGFSLSLSLDAREGLGEAQMVFR